MVKFAGSSQMTVHFRDFLRPAAIGVEGPSRPGLGSVEAVPAGTLAVTHRQTLDRPEPGVVGSRMLHHDVVP
jgi:hypothetical protein